MIETEAEGDVRTVRLARPERRENHRGGRERGGGGDRRRRARRRRRAGAGLRRAHRDARGDAMDLALSGRALDAEAALRVGLVSRVIEHPRAVAEEIARNDADAVRAVKRRLRDDADDRATRERREANAFAELVVERRRSERARTASSEMPAPNATSRQV